MSEKPDSLIFDRYSKHLPAMVKESARNWDRKRKEMFLEEFKRKSKDMVRTYVLWFFLGFHYMYLNNWSTQIMYWVTAGGLFIWALVDLFRIPSMVRNRNQDIAKEIARDMEIMSGN